MNTDKSDELIRKNARTGLIVVAVVIGMVALSFASVPAYRLFCRVTGFGGTTQTAENLPDEILDRTVRVQFNADTAPNMPWLFKPGERSITVHLGERGFTSYEARNQSAEAVGGTAIYNVTPLKAGKYFHKIQCFCFDEQVLKPGEHVSMPVLFYVDPAMNDDPDMNDVQTITLSYTFFRAQSGELDEAMEALYNEPPTN